MYYCKWHIYFWMVVAILFLLSSCQQNDEEELGLYFDTANYIHHEVDSIVMGTAYLEKKLVLNGVSETLDSVEVDDSSFKELQALFTQANLNKGIYRGEYDIDTFWILNPESGENIEVLNYTTDNEELKVPWLQVYSDGSLKALLKENNFLFSYEKEIYYQNEESFSIISWQKTIAQDTLRIFNEVKLH